MKKKKIFVTLTVISVILILGILTCVIISSHIVKTYSKKITTLENAKSFDAECILVLGAKVSESKPSAMLQDRLDCAIELYFEKDLPLIMSGDCSSDEYNEVSVMKDYAIEQGVPPEAILLDPEGYSTFESVTRLKDTFGFKSAIVVTQRYHLYRALFICDKSQVDAIGCCPEDISYKGQTMREIREFAARIKDFYYTLFI